LLTLAGFFLGLLLWSPLARGFTGAALLREPKPSEDESTRRLKSVYWRLATPWFVSFGGVAAWLSVTSRGSGGWMWLFVGIALVPIVTGMMFARIVRRQRSESAALRSNTSFERTRER
jgi:FtsH-binding integral membrane protein